MATYLRGHPDLMRRAAERQSREFLETNMGREELIAVRAERYQRESRMAGDWARHFATYWRTKQ